MSVSVSSGVRFTQKLLIYDVLVLNVVVAALRVWRLLVLAPKTGCVCVSVCVSICRSTFWQILVQTNGQKMALSAQDGLAEL